MFILSTQHVQGSPFYPNTVYKSKTMGTICGAGIAYSYSSEASEITPIFRGARFARWLVFCVVFYRSLFVIWSFIFWSFDSLSFDHWIVYLLIVYLTSIYGFRKPIWYLQTFLKSLDNNSSDPIHHGIFNCGILNMYVAIIIHTTSIYNIISISGSLKNIFITIFPILTYNVHAVWFYPRFISTDLNLYWHKIRSYNDNYGSMATLDQTWPETLKFDTYQRFVERYVC